MSCATSHLVNTATRGIGPSQSSSSGVRPSPSMFFKARRRQRPSQLPGSCLICLLGIDGFGFLAMAKKYQITLIRANRRSRFVLATKRQDMVVQTGTPEKSALMAAATEANHPTADSAGADIASLRAIALKRYRSRCFWNIQVPDGPAGNQIIVERLKKHGDMEAWRLAVEIEALADAA